MAFRAIFALIFVAFLVFIPASFVTARLSKITTTDRVFDAQLPNYHYIVLRESSVKGFTFSEYGKNNKGRRSCVAWYASQPVEVYYRLTGAGKNFDGLRWYKYPENRYWLGSGKYNYRFVRTTTQPVHLMINPKSDNSQCGYRGSTQRFQNLETPVDVLTDLFGLARRIPYLDNEQRVVASRSDVPSLAQTPRSARESKPSKPITLFSALRPKSSSGSKRKTTPSNSAPNMTYWKKVSESHRGQTFVYLTDRQYGMFETQLHSLGHSGSWRVAVPKWKRARGMVQMASLDRRQLLMVMAERPGQYKTVSQSVRAQRVALTRAQWKRVQLRLTRLGYSTGGADGVVGPKTRNAIARWQKTRRYKATGSLTNRHYRKLMNK